jgi:hypothetical protein
MNELTVFDVKTIFLHIVFWSKIINDNLKLFISQIPLLNKKMRKLFNIPSIIFL